jgi:hypothetical protein
VFKLTIVFILLFFYALVTNLGFFPQLPPEQLYRDDLIPPRFTLLSEIDPGFYVTPSQNVMKITKDGQIYYVGVLLLLACFVYDCFYFSCFFL